LITIGKITKPIGLKGEVIVLPLTRDINRFNYLEYIYVPNKRKVEYFKIKERKVILKLKDVNTYREAFLYLRGKKIEIPDEKRIKTKKEEYFIFELKGCSVIDKKKGYQGKIIDIISAGNDILVVKGTKEIYIPFIKKYCLSVNIKKKKVIVDVPDELIALN